MIIYASVAYNIKTSLCHIYGLKMYVFFLKIVRTDCTWSVDDGLNH